MTSDLRSTPGEDAPDRRTKTTGDSPAPRRERSRRTAPAASRPVSSPDASQTGPSPQTAPARSAPSASREALIAIAAYYRAERRGFLPGYEQEDWLAAEREIDGLGTEPF
jgi:hypothetical protein